LASVTAVVEHAVAFAVPVADALGLHTRVVVYVMGVKAVIVPLTTDPNVTVTTESPEFVDMSMVALSTAVVPTAT
jgi:hypothetical protein